MKLNFFQGGGEGSVFYVSSRRREGWYFFVGRSIDSIVWRG